MIGVFESLGFHLFYFSDSGEWFMETKMNDADALAAVANCPCSVGTAVYNLEFMSPFMVQEVMEIPLRYVGCNMEQEKGKLFTTNCDVDPYDVFGSNFKKCVTIEEVLELAEKCGVDPLTMFLDFHEATDKEKS